MTYLVPLAALVALSLLLLGWGTVLYNALVRLQNACDESWSEIDTELRRRYDLIPNLVETVKGYARHERDVLERVSEARNTAAANHGSPASQAQDENILAGGLRQLFVLAENYPDLKANQNFIDLEEELSGTEDRLGRSRRLYNASVRDLNNRVDAFPSNIVAGMFTFQRREYFEIDDSAALKSPAIDF